MKDAAAREQTDTETEATGHGLRVPFSEDEIGRGPLDDSARAPARETPRARAVRRRLAKLIAAKLALDLLFVGAFALYTHAFTFGRGFDGALEHADGRGARGWVVDLERPGEPVEVQLFLNGKFAAATVAEELRSDTDAGSAHSAGRRGFTFRFERDRYGEHEVRVYAVREGRGGARRTLQRFGEILNFIWK
jgi:hypothetical protein